MKGGRKRAPTFFIGEEENVWCPGEQKKDGFIAILFMEAAPGFEPGNRGFADRCLTAWLCRLKNGAGNGI